MTAVVVLLSAAAVPSLVKLYYLTRMANEEGLK